MKRKNFFPVSQLKADMTPMIDVTFLILIFFLCTLRFYTVEGKLDSHLSQRVGTSKSAFEEPKEDIVIHLTGNSKEVKIWLGDNLLQGSHKYKVLMQNIKLILNSNSNTSIIIDAEEDIPYADIIYTLDSCKQANPLPGPLDIKFRAKKS